MIAQSKYLPRQMNGPVINAIMQALETELSDADEIIKYLHNLSIRTAQEKELMAIGDIIGFVRPLVPDGFNEENIFLFGSVPLIQDESIGLSGVNSEIGGQLVSTEPSENFYMDLAAYRKLLPSVAYIKRYGITLNSVDKIAKTIDSEYTITWDENNDINLTFTRNIGFKNVWILTKLFYRFAIEPQVIVTSGV